ncbi:sulfurtransferase TusA family protein [Acinetobacter bouvetii]|uniref:sulfurtransferase TusA family protein n=1 Tax=Acinetobacter bouvetii TaxID=202951 RepID=UPI00157BC10D|nr:sulfurtransferase TusA family protein [Acinetobacter bouvetii]
MDNLASSVVIIDAMGKPCPMPLLMLKRTLKNQLEHVFLLKSSDPHSQQDVIRYCQMHQLKCNMTKISDSEYHYLIES